MSTEPAQRNSEPLIDIIVGVSDGLVIPFALATGMSRVASGNTTVILTGMAGVVLGAAAMAFGSFYAAKHEQAHDDAKDLELYAKLGLEQDVVNAISEESLRNKDEWEQLTMQHGQLPDFDAGRSRSSALNIAIAYAGGGLIPLTPYFFTGTIADGLKISVAVTIISLFFFGYLKAKYTSQNVWGAAFKFILTGCVAAAAAFFTAGLFA